MRFVFPKVQATEAGREQERKQGEEKEEMRETRRRGGGGRENMHVIDFTVYCDLTHSNVVGLTPMALCPGLHQLQPSMFQQLQTTFFHYTQF